MENNNFGSVRMFCIKNDDYTDYRESKTADRCLFESTFNDNIYKTVIKIA